YEQFKKATMILGEKRIRKASLSAVSCENITIRDRSIMGIIVPLISYSQKKVCCNQYGFQETSHCLDQTVKQFFSCLEKLARLAQIEITLWRLASELKKTQRRANALHNIFIPEYRDTIKYLEDSLEEKEREELFQLKRVKNR
ncbi:MAG: V-type ATP synthase subunit D, partial [bacterium]